MEGAPSDEEVGQTLAWSQGWEYRERNFAREALVINPLKACQPLGAVLAALGFAGTLPYVHGSQDASRTSAATCPGTSRSRCRLSRPR